MMTSKHKTPLISAVLGIAVSMGSGSAGAEGRWFKPGHVEAGRTIFESKCAACHGVNGQGAPDWQQREKDGLRLAPPLNGTGHGWHHGLRQLYAMIHDGIEPGMPAWKEQLQQGEILAVIAYFQSWWPEDIYAAWSRMNKEQSRADQSL